MPEGSDLKKTRTATASGDDEPEDEDADASTVNASLLDDDISNQLTDEQSVTTSESTSPKRITNDDNISDSAELALLRDSYWLTRIVVLRFIGAIYFVAFLGGFYM